MPLVPPLFSFLLGAPPLIEEGEKKKRRTGHQPSHGNKQQSDFPVSLSTEKRWRGAGAVQLNRETWGGGDISAFVI